MRTALQAIVVALAVVVLGGCNAVTISQPLGTPLAAEKYAAFEGTWLVGDTVVHAKAAEGPVLRLAWTNWEPDKGWKLHEAAAVLTEHDGSHFVNIRDTDARKERLFYVFARVAPADDMTLVLYLPSPDAFVAAVEAGRLKGKVGADKNGAEITARPEELRAFISRERLADQFVLDSPLVARKIGKP